MSPDTPDPKDPYGEIRRHLTERFLETSGRSGTTNPAAGEWNVQVSVPEKIEVTMVQANDLTDYEIWFFMASCLFTVAVGFGVAWAQDERHPDPLLLATALFLGFFVGAVVMALSKRKRMAGANRTFHFQQRH